ncbi:MAG: exodeoxyribonuclease VII small subunit [Gammaproteobacteria bacterium]|nr:exodeoxyribonuclease VII small subunit [Gammaproteobacteria bacterium]
MDTLNTELDIEAMLAKLEEIHAQLEKGDLPFRKALVQYEEGLALLQQCRNYLKAAEQHMKQLHDRYDEDTVQN